MPKVQVFDPPMCCSTGVCGPEVDPALVRFASDLEWLETKGVEVERFNLSQGPAAFVGRPGPGPKLGVTPRPSASAAPGAAGAANARRARRTTARSGRA